MGRISTDRMAALLYRKLDDFDRERIKERMQYFLEDEKYIKEEEHEPKGEKVIYVDFCGV